MLHEDYFRSVYLIIDRYIWYLLHDKSFENDEKDRQRIMDWTLQVGIKTLEFLQDIESEE